MFTLTTDRLFLREITIEDAEHIYQNFTETVTKYMYPDPPESIDTTKAFIEWSIKGNKEKTNLQLVMFNKLTNEFIGLVALHNIDKKDPEMGIWIREKTYGNRFGIEGATALIEYAHDNLDFEYIKYPVDRNNYASRQIPIKNKGVVKKEYIDTTPSGKKLDTIEYWIMKK